MSDAWKKKYLTAIIAISDSGLVYREPDFKKYRNISKDKISDFEVFIKSSFPFALHINYYERADRSFVKRVYL